MLAATSLAAVLLLATSVSAVPQLHPPIRPRQTTDPALQPWVTVADDGTPKTVTPVLTTVSGKPTIISGAPYELTGTVFTRTDYGKVSTSTGDAPEATATASNGAGTFEVCHNKNGALAPWCIPTDGANLYPGKTYYFTWDSTYFAAPNTTVEVQANYLNSSTGAITTQAFSSKKMAASWGFFAFAIESSLMQGSRGVNISVQLAVLSTAGQSTNFLKGPTILVTNPPTYVPEPTKAPTGLALYIGLPTVLAFVIIVLFGTCMWNRKARKINIPSVMGRGRNGYGVGKSMRSRMGRKKKADERILLMEREVQADGGDVYRDMPDRPRRDSDALGSLAGTPTEERRMDFGRPGTREGREKGQVQGLGLESKEGKNLFRDELKRQNGDRL